MADKDYKKIIVGFHKKRQDNARRRAAAFKSLAKAKLRATTLKQMFLQATKDIAKLSSEMEKHHREWSKRADEMIAIQAKLKSAVKAKDQDEVKKLQDEMKLVHNVASAIAQRFKAADKKMDVLQSIHESNYKQLSRLT